jgi:hypothetical protein
MLHLYLFFKDFNELRKLCDIDLSCISSELLADECDNIINHHTNKKIFLGYLEPGWMLDPKHDARIRRIIRKFDVYMISFFPKSISFSWKNEIEYVYLDSKKNENSNIIDNGSIV